MKEKRFFVLFSSVLVLATLVFSIVYVVPTSASDSPGVDINEFPICTDPAEDESPAIDGNTVVWLGGAPRERGLYSYDLDTGETSHLIPSERAIYTKGMYWSPTEYYAISGNIVVWFERVGGQYDVLGYNLESIQELTIPDENGLYPDISGNKIVWIEGREIDEDEAFALRCFDLVTEELFDLCTTVSEGDMEGLVSIDGDYVVWVDTRNSGTCAELAQSIYGYQISTGEEFLIAEDVGIRDCKVDINDGFVVWVDERNGNQDICGYDISQGEEFAICTNTGEQWDVAIDGDIVVWLDRRKSEFAQDVYGYSLGREVEFPICTNRNWPHASPLVSGDTVVWVDKRDGNYDIYGATIDFESEEDDVGEGEGCFIATAAYGSDTAEELNILRQFRDEVLLPNSLGAEFVSFYYKVSPPVADFISQHDVLRTIVREGLVAPVVNILEWTRRCWNK